MYIKSPINYTWNKYRLLDQFSSYIPENVDLFVDLFCWWATVWFNVKAKKIVLIDSNKRIINLLKTLAEEDINKIIKKVEDLIKEYNLSYSYKYTYKYYKDNWYVEGNNWVKKYNESWFKKLRADYNKKNDKDSFEANIMLYTLMVYGFNNDIRFNKYWEYNLPCWKTDFNKNNYNKIIEFNQRAKEINYEFICWDFREKNIQEIITKANFLYCDPPYLITDAVYNEWHWWWKEEEIALLTTLTKVHKRWGLFALSNVTQKKSAKNELLINWIEVNWFNKNNIDYHYRSSSYNKIERDWNEEEVLVTNNIITCKKSKLITEDIYEVRQIS